MPGHAMLPPVAGMRTKLDPNVLKARNMGQIPTRPIVEKAKVS